MDKKWWYDYPWRQVQTNLREIDMADIDAEEYVRQLQSFHATVAMINTSGIIASYKTDLPFHYQSPYLTGDSLEEIIRVCHREGIRVIARTDFSKVRRPIYEQYPQWAYRRRDGGIVDYNGDVHVCINSDYQQQYALQIMEETVNKLDIDGMFFNMGGFIQRDYSWNFYELCHCDKCKERFQAMYGLALPESESLADPAYRAYKRFQQEVLRDQNDRVYRLLTSLNPGLCISKCADEGLFRQEANTALDRPLPRWQYDAAEHTKYVTSSYGHGMISTNTSVDFIDFPARHAAVSPSSQRLRLYQSLAQGGALDYYLIGRLDNHQDRSGYAPVKEVFSFHQEHQDTFQRLESCAEIALLKDPDGCQEEYRGWYRFLAENHFLFDTPLKNRLSRERLARYKTIILPDCKYLPVELTALLDAFVEQGGTLLSVYHSAMGDEEYLTHKAPRLKCLGIEEVLCSRNDMRGSYFTLDKYLFPSLPETEVLYLDGCYAYVQRAEDTKAHCALIPPQPFGPPERCYPTIFSDHPCFITRQWGKGKALYLPWKPGQFFYRQGYPSYLRFARDLLQEGLGVDPVQTDLPEMVEVTCYKRENTGIRLIFLVNNSGHFGLSFYDPVPLKGYQLRIDPGMIPKRATGLVSKQELPFTAEGNLVTIDLHCMGMYEALLLE